MNAELRKLIHSLVFPVFFLIIIWLVKFMELALGIKLSFLGIRPLDFTSLIGLITAPLIHGDFNHLISNSLPVLFLSIGLFYFYNKIAYKVFFLIYFLEGFWLWFVGREANHIGASGIIYGLVAFLFFSGILRKHKPLIAISLLVSFLYGGMIWGIFPTEEHISWEGHLMGFIAGIVIAYYYRSYGPQQKKVIEIYGDEIDDEDADFVFYSNSGGFNKILYNK